MLKTRQTFRVGETVRFRFISGMVQGKVIEDRGPIGREGQHLYRVRTGGEDGIELELPADELEKNR